MLKEAVDVSFNMVSIDTDTSTSDTVAIMVNGLAGDVDLEEFRQAMGTMAIDLAKDMARWRRSYETDRGYCTGCHLVCSSKACRKVYRQLAACQNSDIWR